MAKIFVIMGKSSSGKDTIYNIIKNQAYLRLNDVVMYTTRPMRDGELEGREYFFTDNDKLNQLKNQKKIIECRTYNTVYGQWNYFTADDGQINMEGTDNYIVIGTLEAYDAYVSFYGKERVIPIYIQVEDKIRLRRALEREEKQKVPKYSEMCRRYLADEDDFSEEKLLKVGITKRYFNDNLEKCVAEITADIEKIINM